MHKSKVEVHKAHMAVLWPQVEAHQVHVEAPKAHVEAPKAHVEAHKAHAEVHKGYVEVHKAHVEGAQGARKSPELAQLKSAQGTKTV